MAGTRKVKTSLLMLVWLVIVIVTFMQLSVFAMTIPSTHPRGFAPKLLSPWRICMLAFALGGWEGGFAGVAPEGRAFVYKQFLSFFGTFIIMARIGD